MVVVVMMMWGEGRRRKGRKSERGVGRVVPR
jgi:hypothetical protein